MDKFANLSTPLKWTVGVAGIGALMGLGAAIMSGAWMFILVLILLLAFLLGGYLLFKAWRRKLRSAQLGGELAQHSSASPRGISDPGQRARLDDLRKKFETGVREYKARGKDLYKLPWYAIVGEPGSGKTEAVRHSNVGFPPGMQDEFQGVGGTINMNWWFTNNAVLLDTAGRLMFEEVRPGETSEWKEFLTLLKKNRPNCPINGLLLVIPSDSLIKDSADDIQRKAGKIAQQLDVIQRVLDVRFPVFIIVTKCDKINGFREFFDGLTDPQLQHQMTGWSNPSPLDDPFRPDLVDQHLNQVVKRLGKRRLGLLRDPVPENSSGRRTDEVDSLYALPHSLSLLAPRLRRYLETIFVAGEWSSKPLFLRGIYFSSSMREGSALDAELAEAIGVPVDDLPEGKVWERDRAYFLRDLFIEKVFRERGLVTRASNTATMLRTQQIILFGSGALALVLFVFFAWYGTRNLETTVKRQSDVWVNATNWWATKTWKQSVIPQTADGVYSDALASQMEVAGKKISIADFHLKLREQATNEMKSNWMMPGLAGQYNRDSKRAQRIVFEGGVVKPLVEAARLKMERALKNETPPERGQEEAFITLFRLEGDLLTRNKEANKGEIDRDGARRFLSSLIAYVTGQDATSDANLNNLVDVMAWTYSDNEEGRGKWPPVGLSGAVGSGNSLANNAPLRVALELYLKNARTNVQTQFRQWGLVSDIAKILEDVQARETLLFSAVKAGDDKNAETRAAALVKLKDDLDKKLAEANQTGVFRGGVSLTNAYARFTGLITGGTAGEISRWAEKYRQLAAQKDQALFAEVIARLREVQTEVTRRFQEVAGANQRMFAELDKSYLVSPGFIERGGLYQESFKLAEARLFQGPGLVGDKGEKWQKFTTEVGADSLGRLRKRAGEYSGDFKASFEETAAFVLKRTERLQRDAFFRAYMDEANTRVGEPLGFPLVKASTTMMKPDALKNADKALTLIAQDAPTLPKASASENPAWNAFAGRADVLGRVSRAILGDELTPGECTVSLLKMEESTRTQDAWRESGAWRDLKLIASRAAGAVRTSDPDDQKLGSPTVEQRLIVQLIQNVGATDPKTSAYDLGEWGAIAMLHRSKNPPVKAEPTTWTVNLALKPEDGQGSIRLKLKFDRPFPELENWPAR